MVFDSRGPFLDTTAMSASKMNGMCRISGSGADLAGLSPAIHRFLHCTVTGSGFTSGHNYMANTTNDAYVDESNPSAAVVSYVANIAGNSKILDTNTQFTFDVHKAKWVEAVSGTGSVADDTDGSTGELSIKLLSGGTSGGRSSVTQIGLMQDFSKRSFFQAKTRIATLSSMNCRGGVNCDLVTDADSNTISYSFELCTATNNNWFVRTASGSNKSATDTSITATTNRVAVKLEHYPDLGTPSVLMYVDSAAAVQKTSNIPITGSGANNKVIRFSNKNSTGSERSWFMYGCRLVYQASGAWT